MKKLSFLFLFIAVFAGTAFIFPVKREEKEIKRTFAKKQKITLRAVSGDCIVKVGAADKIEVTLTYAITPEKNFTPVFEEEDDELKLKEEFKNNTNGHSKWVVTVPANTIVDVNSTSGNCSVSGIKNLISAHSVSGDVKIEEAANNLNLGSVSGNIWVNKIAGAHNIRAKSVSGNIDITEVDGKMDLKTTSGNITVRKFKGDREQIAAKTLSGEVYIN